MIYLTGDCPPADLKLICPNCRRLLSADPVREPGDKFLVVYLSCPSQKCSKFKKPRVRYSWPFPPLYFEQPNFWCHSEDPLPVSRPESPAALPVALEHQPTNPGASPGTDEATPVEAPGNNPTKGDSPMTQKTPAEMPQLSAREKLLYAFFVRQLDPKPQNVQFSVPVGHEMLAPPASGNGGVVNDSDPRLFRIDAVQTFEDHIKVVEVKTRADLKALGQLLTYVWLYSVHYKAQLPVVPFLVFEEASPIVLAAFVEQEIPVVKASIDSGLGSPPGEA